MQAISTVAAIQIETRNEMIRLIAKAKLTTSETAKQQLRARYKAVREGALIDAMMQHAIDAAATAADGEKEGLRAIYRSLNQIKARWSPMPDPTDEQIVLIAPTIAEKRRAEHMASMTSPKDDYPISCDRFDEKMLTDRKLAEEYVNYILYREPVSIDDSRLRAKLAAKAQRRQLDYIDAQALTDRIDSIEMMEARNA